MAEARDGLSPVTTGAFSHLPSKEAEVLQALLSAKHPALAAALATTDDPTRDQRGAVQDALADELMTQIHGPDWEPTAYGHRLEATIDAFLARYPIEPSGS